MKKYFLGKERESTKEYIKKIEAESKQAHYVEILGKRFIILPSVFSPKYFRDPEFFAQELPIVPGETFLEIGCGSGIISIFAVLKGASHVVAIDINPQAVKNTRQNAATHHIQDRITIMLGNVFSPLKEEKFDTIFWNTPWGLVKENNLSPMEAALWDTEYQATTRFITEAKKHLTENGRVLIGFSSTIGDINYLQEILKAHKYSVTIVKEMDSRSIDFAAKFEIIEARPLG